MEEKKKVKESKNSNRGPIHLDSIPISDCEMALEEFNDGSIGLEKCLRAMWQRGLKTYSCRANYEEPYEISHVTVEEGIDIFSYLSPIILNNDMVQIDIVDNKQTIRFAGKPAIREGAILDLVRAISSGKKKHTKLLEEKVGKPFPESWLKEVENYYKTQEERKLLLKNKNSQ